MPSSQSPQPADRRYSRRLMWLAVFIVILFGGYSAAWFFIADKVEQRIDQGIAEMRNEDGVTAECDRRQISGFPFRFELFCDRVVFDNPRANVALQAGAMRSARQIYDPRHTVGELDSPFVIAAPLDVQFDWTSLRASVRDGQPVPQRVSIVADDLKATGRPATDPKPLFAASHLEAHMRSDGPAVDLAADFSDLIVDPIVVEGRTIAPLSGTLDATFANGVAITKSRPLSLRGQTGEIRQLQVESGEGRIVVNGPIAFDADGLANGKLNVAIENPDAVSKVFQAAIPEQADAIRTGFQALRLMGSRPAVQLDIEQGQARFGFIRLGRLPPVN